MLKDIIITVIIVVLLVAIFMIARRMVKKRTYLAKRCVIGHESPEKLEELKNLAKNMFVTGTISIPSYWNDMATYQFSFELEKKNHEITMARIKTEQTIVTCSSEHPEPFVFHNGLSERGATFFVFVGLLGILFYVALLFILILLAFHFISFSP